jgi:hypothetical protein
MMNTQRKTFAVLALAAALAALAGCNKGDEKAAPPAASTPPAPTAPSGSGAPAGATAGLPAECDAYLTQVSACMDKLGASNPAAASFKQQLDAAKTQWATISDKTQLASQCKQSADLFAQSASQMGCK